MIEDVSDDGGLGDESEYLHLATASIAGQRVDLVNAIDELGPSFVGGAAGRSRLLFIVRANRFSGVLPDAIGVSAVEMDQVLVGHGNRPHSGCFEGMRCCGAPSKGIPPQNVDEDSGDKLEGVGEGVIDELVSGFRLVDEQAGAPVESQSREVDGRAHEIAS
jgi:hypothetical protein